MRTYAIIEEGVVVNLAVAAGSWPFPNQTAIEITNPEITIGWTWDGGTFLPPAPAPASTGPRFISKLALYERVTDAELAALDAFLATQATVRQRLRWTDAQEIDRNEVEVQALAVALYGEARAAEILA